jgi:hypothetical protein
MTPARRVLIQLTMLALVLVGLFLLFPRAFAFAEMAARELRYFWWLILLVAFALWLLWAFRKRS